LSAREPGPDEARLLARAAEAGIHVLPVPTPFAVGRVNCLLIEDDPLTLVDTGPNSATSLTELERLLAEQGRKVEDLERIVLTHQHLDHVGLALILEDRSGAEVVTIDALAPWLADYRGSQEADDAFAEGVMRRHGVPEELAVALRALTASMRGWGGSARVDHPVADGSQLAFADRTLEVQLRPGHSPSDTLFLDRERRILVGGDHLLGRISSNPLVTRPLDGPVDAPRPHALQHYIDSQRRTRELELDLVLPGHGPPIEDHVPLIDERMAGYERRAERIAGILAERGPTSAHEVALVIWGNVAVTQAYLTLSEVLGHLDLLVADGRAEEHLEDGHATFALT
jgi:glyoxylase-like metal-dependent hydrolase (beta-lactamase superfamily II)